MERPSISIIVPIYNVEEYVTECVESIINQSYKNLQIILVDDGSTDSSGLICDEFEKADNRIEVIHQKNAGLVEARKSGLKRAKGEYVGFVDGDDYIDKNMYECLLDFVLKENADIVHTGYWCNDGDKLYKKTDFKTEIISSKNGRMKLIGDILNMDINIEPSIWSKLFKKEVIINSYSSVHSNCSYGEDLVCFITSIICAEKIYVLDKAYYHYRKRNMSLSHGMGIGGIDKEVILRNNIKDVLIKYDLHDMYKESLDYFLGKSIVKQMKNISLAPFMYETFYFDEPQRLQEKRIVIYGAGAVGRDYYSQFCRYTYCDVVAWVDKNSERIKIPYVSVLSPNEIKKVEYDYIILAVLNREAAERIKDTLKKEGVNEEKIVWKQPRRYK